MNQVGAHHLRHCSNDVVDQLWQDQVSFDFRFLFFAKYSHHMVLNTVVCIYLGVSSCTSYTHICQGNGLENKNCGL